ncbi:MAG: zinc-binding dehydrogenase [Anaerolineae bacterium]|nr:zinc-binding dehydrogenase [Anaerolineae bacterium]
MKQAVMTKAGEIELHDVPAPTPGQGEVLLRVQRIGVCGSDIHVYHGKHPLTSYPVVQGHEFSAVLEAVGPGVAGLMPGTKVTSMPQIVCGECAPCRRGDYHICDKLKVQGFQAPGCAQELWTTSADMIISLPDTFTFEQGALVEPAAVAVHAVERVGKLAGHRAVVLGAGPIGNLVAQTTRAAGAQVLITDLSDYRLEVARQCGLANTSNPKQENLADAARRVFGNDGFDVAFECVGVEATITEAVANIQKGGTIVIVGVFGDKPRLDMSTVQDRELNIRGTLMYKRPDYIRAVELIGSGGIITEPLVSKHYSIDNYLEAYRYIDKFGDKSMKVVIDVA